MGQAELLMNEWQTHRKVLEQLLQLIPDEHVDFKPWEDAMTLSELAQHIVLSAEMFLALAKTGRNDIKTPATAECTTMEEVRRIVHESTVRAKELYTSLTDEDLRTEFDHPHPNLKGPRRKLAVLVNDHEIHHKGQLFIYARMIGIHPVPFFK